MIRLSRLADYGVALMTQIALAGARVHSAQELAVSSGVPLPTVSKLLAALARAGLLVASRGARGGYRLAQPADAISVGAIVSAVDGPIALTQCIEHGPGTCEVEVLCPTQHGWKAINEGVRRAFNAVSLAELMWPHAQPWAQTGSVPASDAPARDALERSTR
ncbi:MAG: SUF system Fe-S cluster assembly regulator [Defluviicoccus sp.]